MVQRTITASRENIGSVLQGCTKKKELSAGLRCHSLIGSSGLGSSGFLTDRPCYLFASCESLVEANIVFEKASGPNVYTWNEIISSQVKLGEGKKALKLYHNMQQEGVKPDKFTFSCMLKACSSMGSLGDGILIHEQIIRSGLQSEVVIGTALVDMYAKCGGIEQARKLFDELPQKNVVTWGAMLAGYVQHGLGDSALQLFKKMEAEDLNPSKVTLLCTLKACSIARATVQGKLIHKRIIKSGLQDAIIGNTLVDMYAKCGMLEEACKVFNELPSKNVVSWGAMIAGYVQHGHGFLALALFQKMKQNGIKPDKVIFSCVLKACGNIGAIEQGRLIHDEAIKSGLQSDMVIGSTLVDMYAKCGSIEQAQKVFDGLLNRDAVAWNAMFTGHAKYGDQFPALKLLKRMEKDAIKPSKVTLLGILKAYGFAGTTVQSKLLHGHIIKVGLDADVVVGSAIIDTYAKCGSVDDALKVFDTLPSRDQASWGVMISGYSMCGNYKLAWQCLQDMQKQGLIPSDMVLTSILTACSHAALLEEGLHVFKSMREDLDLAPHIEHYSCMVDLLSRAGVLTEAEDLLQTMPTSPDVIAWTSLLTGCQTYGNVEIGKRSFDQFVHCDPTDSSGYVLMSGIYSNSQMWEEADKIREQRNSSGAWKKPGRALVEVENRVQEFFVSDEGSFVNRQIQLMLKKLRTSIKEDGYVPQFDSILESELDKDVDVP